ncbi:hypothetical protein DDB_G0286141 [Dictyostelium discoideum AX4]|uniref:Uncharacterized transmembrane protein DDB_G0286141 n=1 Tax=Dictyostelium discoideum TaxID=44689 RepID=Y6832_DICDI|nr:hypothetical protein DDB_G0286141 [Dictyostelium discoideum AX4]Q54M75.1 RecName: Full=Uncharacterized transmembrane protein DDB_G0286141; Flags: Precursor [Dictyostelium discoideum]EAL64363.1 hypothetical protein DDB_G0286141 [Dictyostelium discoideum AX4]|eukprot:XP_637873.1 hypothetical protein DDB_G0286141 [Dictyostelium discoideum AX4]
MLILSVFCAVFYAFLTAIVANFSLKTLAIGATFVKSHLKSNPIPYGDLVADSLDFGNITPTVTLLFAILIAVLALKCEFSCSTSAPAGQASGRKVK